MCKANSCTEPAGHSVTGACGQSSFSAAAPKAKPSQCLMPQQSPYLNINSIFNTCSALSVYHLTALQPPGLPPKTPQGLNTGAVPGEDHGVLSSGVLVLFVYQEFMHLFSPLCSDTRPQAANGGSIHFHPCQSPARRREVASGHARTPRP